MTASAIRLPLPGEEVLGRFHVMAARGGGAMGVLFEAFDRARGHKVALKVLRPEILHLPEIVERIHREGIAISRVNNPHVVRVFDTGRTELGLPFLSMEWLEGTDLGGLLDKLGSVPIHTAVGWVRQACIGLAEVHAAGIVHRDLKPENLFLAAAPNGAGILKVIDFGVSKVDLGAAHLTQTHVTVGTPLYMSPEQVRALRDVDARSDVWALGVVLFELISGQPPFAGESAPAVTAAIAADPARKLRDFLPGAPEALEFVIDRALRKNRAERFASVLELAEALAPFETPVPLQAEMTLVTELPPDFAQWEVTSGPSSVGPRSVDPAVLQPVGAAPLSSQALSSDGTNGQPPLPAAPQSAAAPVVAAPVVAAPQSVGAPRSAPVSSIAAATPATLKPAHRIALGVALGLSVVVVALLIGLGSRERRALRAGSGAPSVSEPGGVTLAQHLAERSQQVATPFAPCLMRDNPLTLGAVRPGRLPPAVPDLDALFAQPDEVRFTLGGSGRPARSELPIALVSPRIEEIGRDDVSILAVTNRGYYVSILGKPGVEQLDDDALARFSAVLDERAPGLLIVAEGELPLLRLKDALKLVRKLRSVGLAIPVSELPVEPREKKAFACNDSWGLGARPASQAEIAGIETGLEGGEASCGRENPFDLNVPVKLRVWPGSSGGGQACWEDSGGASDKAVICATTAGKKLSTAMPASHERRALTFDFVPRGSGLRAFCE